MRRLVYSLTIISLLVLAFCSIEKVFVRSLYGGLSAELLVRETENSGIQRIDYVDENDRITFAVDLGYATVLRTRDEKRRPIREVYLDEDGKPVMLPAGYGIIVRQYEGSSGSVWITYLNTSGNPIVTIYGYSMIYRTYTKSGKAKTDMYFNEAGKPVKSVEGYYGFRREYDENLRLSGIWYLDKEGKPARNADGYVFARYEYDDEGKLSKILYYDENRNPIQSRYKVYGAQYNGAQKIYLDRDGKPLMRLDTVLHAHPYLVLAAGVLLLVAAMVLPVTCRWLLALAYIVFIFYMTLWYREGADSYGNFELFWSYRQFFTRPSLRQEILNNIWLFVPLGALLYKPGTKNWVIIILVSVGIEAMQYMTGTGLCEFDDIISNTLGGFIGWLAAAGLQGNRQKREEHHGGT
ncbi:MAG: VanZ family protein [Butyrivibrio sp.]|nr:VanZ family protein [Butyrivibrio sp.]